MPYQRLVMVCLIALLPFAPGSLAAEKTPATRPAAGAFKDDLLTSDNYAKIEKGMTKDEVKAILGPNRSGMSSSANHDSTMTWNPKGDNKHHIQVNFKDGVVVSKSSTIDFAGQAAATAKQAAAVTASALGGNFAKLKLGMSEDEVQAIMGAPTKVDRASAGRSGFTWTPDAEKFAYVIFQDGKATEMDCSEAPAKSHEITVANYRRVHAGMALADVQALLGQATEEQQPGKDMRYTWRKDKLWLAVAVKDGKVVSKSSSFKDAPLVAFEKTADDQFNIAVANLSSTDMKKVKSALGYMAHATYDEMRAPEVSLLIEKHLGSKDSFVVMDAEQAIRKWATKENVPHFMRILSKPVGHGLTDKGRDHLPLAIEIMGKLREPSAVPHLVRLLKDFFSRDEVEFALKQMGPELCEAELRKLWNSDSSPAVRNAVDDILGEFKDGGINLTRNLKDLTSPSKELRSLACQALAKMYVHPRRKADVAKAIEPLLNDADEYVASFAARALARWGSAANEPMLIAALAKPSAEVRLGAALALGQVGTAKAVPSLEPLADEKDKRVAEAARDALVFIKKR